MHSLEQKIEEGSATEERLRATLATSSERLGEYEESERLLQAKIRQQEAQLSAQSAASESDRRTHEALRQQVGNSSRCPNFEEYTLTTVKHP